MQFYQFNFVISQHFVNKSVKEYLALLLIPKHVRGLLRQDKRLFLNGQPVSTAALLAAGDKLSFKLSVADFSEKQQVYPSNNLQQISIVYENDDCIIVDKPAGMKMHPHSPNETDTLLNFVQAALAGRRSHGLPASAYMVHRIDTDTSGLVLIATNPLAAAVLNQLIAKKIIKRTYLAWVSGHLSEPNGVITLPIAQDPKNLYVRIVDPSGQPALTRWVKMHVVYQNTLLRIQLATGRTHQIRVHLAAIGHPLIGDRLYGGPDYPRLLLHSASIELPDLFTDYQQLRRVTSPLPADFPRQLYLR